MGGLGSIPGSGVCPGEGSANPLQYSCLENFMDSRLSGYSPWDGKDSNMTEQLSLSLLYPETLTKSLISCRSLLYFCCPLAFSMSTVVSLANRDSFISSFLIDMLFNSGHPCLFLITGGKHSAFHHQV